MEKAEGSLGREDKRWQPEQRPGSPVPEKNGVGSQGTEGLLHESDVILSKIKLNMSNIENSLNK